MAKLWIMIIGVIPLWLVMQYWLKVPTYGMMVVYVFYFMIFVLIRDRMKKNS